MPNYEWDEYAQEHVDDDAFCVYTVASWRVHFNAKGRLERLVVDQHNGWIFDSQGWCGRADAPSRLLAALQRARLRWTPGMQMERETGCCLPARSGESASLPGAPSTVSRQSRKFRIQRSRRSYLPRGR